MPVVWYENQPPGPIVNLTAKDYDSPENGPPFSFALVDSANQDIRNKFNINGEFSNICRHIKHNQCILKTFLLHSVVGNCPTFVLGFLYVLVNIKLINICF